MTELSKYEAEEKYGPLPYVELGAVVSKFRRKARSSIYDLSRAERVAYADTIEKAIRAKHRILHMRPSPSINGRGYSPPSIMRLLRYENPLPMVGDPSWNVNHYNQWEARSECVYAAMMKTKKEAQFYPWVE
jgi:hypothetical protein